MNVGTVIAPIVIAFATVALVSSHADPQTCRWDGSAPFCDGECGAGETEKTRASANDVAVQQTPSENNFGDSCVTGSKALCCNTPGISCRWDGTAPFCDGECKSSEKATSPPPGSNSGKACVTGSKVFCCTSTGTSGQPIQAATEYARFAAIWEKRSSPLWAARHGMTSSQYQTEYNNLEKQGYRLVDVSGYGVGGKDYYAAIWEKSSGPLRAARHGMTSAQYQTAYDDLKKQGYRLIVVSGYDVGGQDHYTAIWEKSSGPTRVARHGMSSAQYQDQFNKLTQQGYRLVWISGWGIGGTNHYAAIWEKSSGPTSVARHGLISDSYQETFDDLNKNGYRLTHISGYYSHN
jgi:hypothetical protein